MGISLVFTGMTSLIAVSIRRFLKSSIVVSLKRQDCYRNGKGESCKCVDHVFETDDCRYPCDGKWGEERCNRLNRKALTTVVERGNEVIGQDLEC
jgi:hypothetical protein